MKSNLLSLALICIIFVCVIALSEVSADVQVRVVSYIDGKVVATQAEDANNKSFERRISLPPNGSALFEAKVGSVWVFTQNGKALKEYPVTESSSQVVEIGEPETFSRTFINRMRRDVQARALVPSEKQPGLLAHRSLFTLKPGAQNTIHLRPRSTIQFLSDDRVIEPAYQVASDGQSPVYEIHGQVQRTVHNYLTTSVDVQEKRNLGENPPKQSIKARHQKTLTVRPGSQLSFISSEKAVAPDYVITDDPTGDIKLGGAKTSPDSKKPTTTSPTTDPKSLDPEWLAWVRKTGSDFLDTPPVVNKPLRTNDELWGRQSAHIPHCIQGYNVLKMDPRRPGYNRGIAKKTSMLFKILDDGMNWYIDGKYGTNGLLPTYLRLRQVAGSNGQSQQHVFMTEAEHMNSWSVSAKLDVKAGGEKAASAGTQVGFNYGHVKSNKDSKNEMTVESFKVDWSDWAVLNKDQLQLNDQFANRIKQLEGAAGPEFFQFFEDYGTHYPVATLFGGRESVHEKASTKSMVESESNTFGVHVGINYDSQNSTNTTTMNRNQNRTEDVYGSLNDKTAMLPVQLVLEPMSELIRPQLVEVDDYKALQREMDRQFEAYRQKFETENIAEHHLFKVQVQVRLLSSDDWEKSFDSYKSHVELSLMDISDSPPSAVAEYPRILLNQDDIETHDTYVNTDMVNDTSYVAIASENELKNFRFFMTYFIQDYDKTAGNSNDFAGGSLPHGLVLNKTSETYKALLSQKAIDLRNVVKLRGVEDRIVQLARQNDEIQRIEERDFLNAKSVLDGRIEAATNAGLQSYVDALLEVKSLQDLCTHKEERFTRGLGKVLYQLKISEVTHPAEVTIDFPAPPIDSP